MSEQMTLGALIEELEKCNPEANVRFDFGYFCPAGCISYRGYYDQIALSYGCATWPLVSKVLSELKSAVGTEFTGYKGGKYVMHRHTPVWVSDYGETSGVAVVGVSHGKHQVIIRTAHIDD